VKEHFMAVAGMFAYA